jgi:hypothetical protein
MKQTLQSSANRSASITTTSSQICAETIGKVKRVQLIITNISPTTVTINKGDAAAIANQGIILSQNQTYIESDDGGFSCWQGAIQAIASANSNLSIVETYAVEIE